MYINIDRYLKEARKMSFGQTSLQIGLISSHNSVYKNKFDLVNAVLCQIDMIQLVWSSSGTN